MDFLKLSISKAFIFLTWHVVYYLGGFLLYKAGLHRLGHTLVAMAIAPDFGMCKKTRNWLVDHCPVSIDKRSKCGLWTCARFDECKNCKENL